MTIDRNRLEQEAVKLLQKGKTDQAIERYQALVRDDPRDRRIRQKLSELYLQVGRVSEAEQHLRALAKSLVKSGQERQAVPLFKQLVKIKPDDAELREELGDCFIATGFPDDARKTYDAVLEMLERVYPSKAVPVLQKIIKLAPTEMPLQVKLAELYEASNWSEKAALEWQRLAGEARRLGRPDDRARFLSLALRLRPDMLVLLQEAAEARLATDEPQLALTHLQEAYQADSRNVRSLELLARTFQALQQPESARPVWLAAAQAHADAGAAIARADALRAALACGADDPKIKAEFGEADREAARYRLRLHTQPWAAPRAQAEAEVVLRAEVQARYGFPDRARKTLEAAPPSLRSSTSVLVALAELIAAQGDAATAAGLLQRLQGLGPEALAQRAQRVAVLTGDGAATPADAPADFDDDLDDGLIDDMDDELIDDMDAGPAADAFDDRTDPDVGDGDAGDMGEDPLLDDEDEYTDPGRASFGTGLDGALGGDAPGLPDFSDVFSSGSTDFDSGAGEDAFSFLDEPGTGATRAAPTPDALPLVGDLADAYALFMVADLDGAAALAGGVEGLGAALLRARILRARGDLSGATSLLRDAVGDAAETDPDYLPGILEMAALNAATGKLRAGLRLLDEINDIDPDWRTDAVACCRRGIELLSAR